MPYFNRYRIPTPEISLLVPNRDPLIHEDCYPRRLSLSILIYRVEGAASWAERSLSLAIPYRLLQAYHIVVLDPWFREQHRLPYPSFSNVILQHA